MPIKACLAAALPSYLLPHVAIIYKAGIYNFLRTAHDRPRCSLSNQVHLFYHILRKMIDVLPIMFGHYIEVDYSTPYCIGLIPMFKMVSLLVFVTKIESSHDCWMYS